MIVIKKFYLKLKIKFYLKYKFSLLKMESYNIISTKCNYHSFDN